MTTAGGFAHNAGVWCTDCHSDEPMHTWEECQAEECSGKIVPAINARCVSCFGRWTGTEWVEADALCEEPGCQRVADVNIYRASTGTHHYHCVDHLPTWARAEFAALLEE
jgi:hypothetical protein